MVDIVSSIVVTSGSFVLQTPFEVACNKTAHVNTHVPVFNRAKKMNHLDRWVVAHLPSLRMHYRLAIIDRLEHAHSPFLLHIYQLILDIRHVGPR